MRRLFTLILLALSLAMTSGPAFAVPKANCPMATSEQMLGGHQDMDCCAAACAPECAAVCPTGLIPFPERAATPAAPSESVPAWIAATLPSANLAGPDPPPRATFS